VIFNEKDKPCPYLGCWLLQRTDVPTNPYLNRVVVAVVVAVVVVVVVTVVVMLQKSMQVSTD
jgi:hypothetical protein